MNNSLLFSLHMAGAGEAIGKLLLLCMTTTILLAGDRVPVQWLDTPSIIGKHTAIVHLKSGAVLEGKWIAVTPDSFTMMLNSARGSTQSITKSRSDVESLGYIPRRIAGRVLGTFLGFTFTAGIGLHGAPLGPAGALAVAAIGSAAGYTLGRARDRQPVMLLLLPPISPASNGAGTSPAASTSESSLAPSGW